MVADSKGSGVHFVWWIGGCTCCRLWLYESLEEFLAQQKPQVISPSACSAAQVLPTRTMKIAKGKAEERCLYSLENLGVEG